MDDDESEDERVNKHKQKKATSMHLQKLQQVLPYMEKFSFYLTVPCEFNMNNNKFWLVGKVYYLFYIM